MTPPPSRRRPSRRPAGRGSRDPGTNPYVRLAEAYDTVYAWKDYRRESRRLRELVRRYRPGSRPTLLDVGCGTGSHLRFLRSWSDATGLDASSEMLAVARTRLPGVPLVRGRMERFRLDRRVDVLTCLFSAIGYVRTVPALRRTVANFARHLTEGGVAIVEPWIRPEDVRRGDPHVAASGSPSAPLIRVSTMARTRSTTVLTMHYLAAGPTGIRHWSEVHEMGLFSDAAMRSAFEDAGFRVRRLPSRFSPDRGLWVGVLPRPGSPGRGRRGPTRRS